MCWVYVGYIATTYQISSQYINWLWRYGHFCVLLVRPRHLIAVSQTVRQTDMDKNIIAPPVQVGDKYILLLVVCIVDIPREAAFKVSGE